MGSTEPPAPGFTRPTSRCWQGCVHHWSLWGKECTSKSIQVFNRIPFLEVIGLRFPFPCWLLTRCWLLLLEGTPIHDFHVATPTLSGWLSLSHFTYLWLASLLHLSDFLTYIQLGESSTLKSSCVCIGSTWIIQKKKKNLIYCQLTGNPNCICRVPFFHIMCHFYRHGKGMVWLLCQNSAYHKVFPENHPGWTHLR